MEDDAPVLSVDAEVMNAAKETKQLEIETPKGEEDMLQSQLDKTLSSSCNVCNQPATLSKKKTLRTSLPCSECKSLIHFPCSKLPIYELYNYMNSKKRYTCEVCSAPPPSFLADLIHKDITNIISDQKTVDQVSGGVTVGRVELLEGKIDVLTETIDKLGICSISDKLQNMFKDFRENTNILQKTKSSLEKLTKNLPDIPPPNSVDTSAVEKRLQRELLASQSSEALLNEAIDEKNKTIQNLLAEKTKHIDKIDRLHAEKQRLACAAQRLEMIEDTKISLENELEKKKMEESRLNEVITSLEKGQCERIVELQTKCQTLQTQLESKQEDIGKLQASFTRLEDVINKLPVRKQQLHPPKDNVLAKDNYETVAPTSSPKIVLFHDSLCKNINDTMMSREKVDMEKVWAPTLPQTRSEIENLTYTPDCVVIQALTRDVVLKDPMEYVDEIVSTVDLCLTKSEKVVLSLIVDREDCQIARNRLKAVNGLLQVKFMDHPNVTVCEHDKLRDPRNRYDKLHLNEMGTAKLASNLKHSIAKSIGIKVIRKQTTNNNKREHNRRYRQRRNEGHDERYDMYGDFDD